MCRIVQSGVLGSTQNRDFLFLFYKCSWLGRGHWQVLLCMHRDQVFTQNF